MMKIDIFQEKSFSVLVLTPQRIIFSSLRNEKNKYVIEKSEEIITPIFVRDTILRENLEKSLKILIERYKFKEVGFIINLPGIFFQRITIPRTGNPLSSITNYLQATLPFPLEKYEFIYLEDIYHLSGNLANYNLFFFPKEIKEEILDILQSLDLTSFFIVPAFEIILENLIYKALISVNESFLVFYFDESIANIFFIENLRIDKLFIEEIDKEKTNFELFIERFKNYFESQGKKFNILILSDFDLKISNYKYLKIKSIEFINEGSLLLLKKIFQDQPFFDFLSLKPSRIYFLIKIRKTLSLASIFLISLLLIYLGGFVYLDFRLNSKKVELKKEISQISSGGSELFEENLKYFIELANKISQRKEKRDEFLKLTKFYNLEYLNEDTREAIFILNKDEVEKFKTEISKIGLDININEEIVDKDKVRARLRF